MRLIVPAKGGRRSVRPEATKGRDEQVAKCADDRSPQALLAYERLKKGLDCVSWPGAENKQAVLDGRKKSARKGAGEPINVYDVNITRWGVQLHHVEVIGPADFLGRLEDQEVEQDLALGRQEGAEARGVRGHTIQVASDEVVEKTLGVLARNPYHAPVGQMD